MALLTRTDHATYCPYKGDCAYYSIPAGGERSVNAVWTYEAPYDAVAAIKDHLAFYPSRVDAIEEWRGLTDAYRPCQGMTLRSTHCSTTVSSTPSAMTTNRPAYILSGIRTSQ